MRWGRERTHRHGQSVVIMGVGGGGGRGHRSGDGKNKIFKLISKNNKINKG